MTIMTSHLPRAAAVFAMLVLPLEAQAQSQLTFSIPFATPLLLAFAVAALTFMRIRSSHKK